MYWKQVMSVYLTENIEVVSCLRHVFNSKARGYHIKDLALNESRLGSPVRAGVATLVDN